MEAASSTDGGAQLLALYDRGLPQVYGYALSRCGDQQLAEDVTAEAFLAAVDGVNSGRTEHLTVGWLIAVTRNKLVDHWRRREREERKLSLVAGDDEGDAALDDPWDEALDARVARDVLAGLGPHHRTALVLRYVDDLPVPEVAELLDRTVHATEALLVRARAAFRRAYAEVTPDA